MELALAVFLETRFISVGHYAGTRETFIAESTDTAGNCWLINEFACNIAYQYENQGRRFLNVGLAIYLEARYNNSFRSAAGASRTSFYEAHEAEDCCQNYLEDDFWEEAIRHDEIQGNANTAYFAVTGKEMPTEYAY